MSSLRTYVVPIAISAAFVLFTPVGLLVVFLSGDSCCGENTSATMIAITAGIVVVISVTAAVLAMALKSGRRDGRPFSAPVAAAIMAAPASLIHIVFVAVVSATAF